MFCLDATLVSYKNSLLGLLRLQQNILQIVATVSNKRKDQKEPRRNPQNF